MEAKELRIGSAVCLLDDSNPFIITNDRYEKLILFKTFDRLKPIKLTEEWHLKFGGKDVSSPPHNLKFSYDINGASLLVNYDRVKELWWFQYSNPSLINRGEVLVTPLPREIKYVHEFQNFYKEFTGNELNF